MNNQKLNIYISHSKKFDYKNELYKPLLESKIGSYNNLILPHSEQYDKLNTKEILANCDMLIAEVSYPGIGIGLELGRAEYNNLPIICLLKKGQECSSSIERNFTVIEYTDTIDMVKKLEMLLKLY